MKWLFVMLLVLNLIFWFFIYEGSPEEETTTVELSKPISPVPGEPVADLPKAVLPNNKPEEIKAFNKLDSKPAIPDVAIGACYQLGPFEDGGLVEKFAEKLDKQGFSHRSFTSEEGTATSFWVYIPPMESRADAIQAAQGLRAAGINDSIVIATGPKKNAISLGIYANEYDAKKRHEQITKLGQRPQLESRKETKTGYWLEIKNDKMKVSEINAMIQQTIEGFESIVATKKTC